MKWVLNEKVQNVCRAAAFACAAAFGASRQRGCGNRAGSYGADSNGDDGRLHIGFVEYVETDEDGKVTKVHTIEGNINRERDYPIDNKVRRGEWVPGKKDVFGAALCEYIDLEALFAE